MKKVILRNKPEQNSSGQYNYDEATLDILGESTEGTTSDPSFELYSLSYDGNDNLDSINNFLSSSFDNLICFEILEYINNNENDLFTYNLDKNIFNLNIFTPLNKIT